MLFTQLLGRAIQNLEGRRNMFVGNYNRRKEAGEKAYDFRSLPTLSFAVLFESCLIRNRVVSIFTLGSNIIFQTELAIICAILLALAPSHRVP